MEFYSLESLSRVTTSRRPITFQLSRAFLNIAEQSRFLRFDYDLYRSFPSAMRRFYPLANQMGWNNRDSAIFDADEFAIHQIGYHADADRAKAQQGQKHRLQKLRRRGPWPYELLPPHAARVPRPAPDRAVAGGPTALPRRGRHATGAYLRLGPVHHSHAGRGAPTRDPRRSVRARERVPDRSEGAAAEARWGLAVRVGGRVFNHLVEIDMGTASLDAAAANSIKNKILTYEAYYDMAWDAWRRGGKGGQPPRLRALFITSSIEAPATSSCWPLNWPAMPTAGSVTP